MSTMHAPATPVQSLARFVSETREHGPAGERFDNESSRTLGIDVDGGVWLKPGAAIAYRGDIAFRRLPTLAGGSFKNAALREAAPLVKATGKGRLYCARQGSFACVVRLRGETLFVAWQDLLAFEESLSFTASLVGHGVGVAAGGLIVLKLSGDGAVALATHGEPLTLMVEPGRPVSTDPHATLAWSAGLTPQLKTDVSWRSTVGHDGKESIQMFFEGDGFVVVQPFEDPSRIAVRVNPLKRTASIVTA
jgi:uncharacterized protein (AIM24 family)